MSVTRWDMLREGFSKAGLDVEVSRRANSDTEFIEIKNDDGHISIHSLWSYGKWSGWNVARIDREGFGSDLLRRSKTVDEVVSAVLSVR
jgi:hypothetical protein